MVTLVDVTLKISQTIPTITTLYYEIRNPSAILMNIK